MVELIADFLHMKQSVWVWMPQRECLLDENHPRDEMIAMLGTTSAALESLLLMWLGCLLYVKLS